MQKLMDFLQELKTSPLAAELVRSLQIPQDDQQAVECYADLAEKLGCDLSKEEIKEEMTALCLEQRARTAAAEQDIGKAAVHEDVLDLVAGGSSAACEETYQAGEWCWWSDQCSTLINIY